MITFKGINAQGKMVVGDLIIDEVSSTYAILPRGQGVRQAEYVRVSTIRVKQLLSSGDSIWIPLVNLLLTEKR